jgi:hypothetical protein
MSDDNPNFTRSAEFKQEHHALKDAVHDRQDKVHEASLDSDAEFQKADRYAQQQCYILRELEDIDAEARQMFELDNCKDQIMSLLVVALT